VRPTVLLVLCFLATALSTYAAARSYLDFPDIDTSQPVSVTGRVLQFGFGNPKSGSVFVLESTQDTGSVVWWRFYGYSGSRLPGSDWRIDTVRIGQVVTLCGWRAREEVNAAAARYVLTNDGRYEAGPPARQLQSRKLASDEPDGWCTSVPGSIAAKTEELRAACRHVVGYTGGRGPCRCLTSVFVASLTPAEQDEYLIEPGRFISRMMRRNDSRTRQMIETCLDPEGSTRAAE
jgi:hypothetical protein